MTLTNEKVQGKKFKIKKKIEVSIKIFCRQWEAETLPK